MSADDRSAEQVGQALSPGVVRRVLLGLEGPYADPRVATDALDNLAVLVAGLEVAGRRLLASSLLALVVDDDPVIATGAAIGCDSVADQLDPVALEATLFLVDGRLDRAPVGFASSRADTVRGELALAAVRGAGSPRSLVERLVGAASPVQRTMLVAEVAARWPALVVWWAREWVGPDDTGVLARLPRAWQRIAVAGAVRPWSAAAIERIDDIGRWRDWDPLDVAALGRVMRDEAPELTRPDDLEALEARVAREAREAQEGIGRSNPDVARRWWIVAEEPWAWTLWRREDGLHAIEELPPGWSMLGRSTPIDDATARSWLARALAADGPEPTELHR